MIWRRRRPVAHWQRPRGLGLKLGILAFFTVLVLAPLTGWVMSAPMWAMERLGQAVSGPGFSAGQRWFRAALVLAGLPGIAAVAWRAWEDRDAATAWSLAWLAPALALILLLQAPASRQPEPAAERIAPAPNAIRPRQDAAPPRPARAAPARPAAAAAESGRLRFGPPPPALALREFEIQTALLLREAARSTAQGQPFHRQLLELARQMGEQRRLLPREPKASAQTDPSRVAAVREEGLAGLADYLRTLQQPIRIAPTTLAAQRAGARARLLQALRYDIDDSAAWRGLAWTWLYDEPDLATGAWVLAAGRAEAWPMEDAAALARLERAAGAGAVARMNLLQARAHLLWLRSRGQPVPVEVAAQAAAALPPPPPTLPPGTLEPGSALAWASILPPLSESRSRPRGAPEVLEPAWREGAVRVASDADLERWKLAQAPRRQALAPDFDRRIATMPRWRLERGLRLPRDLEQAPPALLLLPAGIAAPSGALGDSLLLELDSGACRGRLCEALLQPY